MRQKKRLNFKRFSLILSSEIDFESQNRRKTTKCRPKIVKNRSGASRRPRGLPGGSRKRSDASPYAPGGAPGAPGAPPGRPKWFQKRRKIDTRSVPGCPPDSESRKSAKNSLDYCSFIVHFGSPKRRKINKISKHFSVPVVDALLDRFLRKKNVRESIDKSTSNRSSNLREREMAISRKQLFSLGKTMVFEVRGSSESMNKRRGARRGKASDFRSIFSPISIGEIV